MIKQTVTELYSVLLSEHVIDQAAAVDLHARLHLRSLAELHFLDWHACALLTRSGQEERPVTLVVESHSPSHIKTRVAAEIIEAKDQGGGVDDVTRGLPTNAYVPGAVLARLLTVPGWPMLWHNYQTSRDGAIRRPRIGATLAEQFPHLRVGFVTGIDLFHCGEYYAAHEEWESLWMRLSDGAERRVAQGLIQLAGAHIHRLKNRLYQAHKLYAAARSHLHQAAAVEALEWLDVLILIEAADQIIGSSCDRPVRSTPWPSIPLHNPHRNIARKHR